MLADRDCWRSGLVRAIVSFKLLFSFKIQSRLLKILKILKDLINEYLMWLPESLHFEVRLKWPPISQA